MEKNIKNWIMDYGVVAHRRFFKKEKIRFINYIEREFREMKYKTQVLSPQGTKGKAINLLIGDVKHAKHIIIANYDTPVKSFGFYAYEPFNLHHRNIRYMATVAIPLILITILFFFFSTYFLKIEWLKGIFHIRDIFALFIYIFGMYLIVRYSKGIPNNNNINRNSSGIITLLHLASELTSEQRANTAFVLTDFGCINHLGDQMIKAYVKTYAKKHFILLDCVGSNQTTALCYSSAFSDKIKNLDDSILAYKVDDKKHSIANIYPNTLVISNGIQKNNTFICECVNTRKDLQIEPAQIQKCSSLIKNIIY